MYVFVCKPEGGDAYLSLGVRIVMGLVWQQDSLKID